MKIFLLTSLLLLFNSPLKAQVKDVNHEKCMQASDYEGCMEFHNNDQSITKNVDCINKWCTPEEAKSYKEDNLGMKVIPDFYFKDTPVERASMHVSPAYKLKVDGKYGEYIHFISLMRYYSEGTSGTSGYSTNIGGGYTNCTGYGSSISCNTSPPTTINIPGKSGTAPGIKQVKIDFIISCNDRKIAQHKNNRLVKTKGNNGKKRKWLDLDNFGSSKSFHKLYANIHCESINSVLGLPSSNFFKYEDKNLKK